MSEKPLFEKMDQDEATYAPQQLPAGSAAEEAARVERDARGSDSADNTVLVPGAFVGGAGTGGTGPSVGPTGTLSGIAPVAGAAGLDDLTRDDDDIPRGSDADERS